MPGARVCARESVKRVFCDQYARVCARARDCWVWRLPGGFRQQYARTGARARRWANGWLKRRFRTIPRTHALPRGLMSQIQQLWSKSSPKSGDAVVTKKVPNAGQPCNGPQAADMLHPLVVTGDWQVLNNLCKPGQIATRPAFTAITRVQIPSGTPTKQKT